MRISDWSSDVCSSDLLADHGDGLAGADVEGDVVDHRLPLAGDAERGGEVGDAQDRRGARHGGGGGGAHDSPLSFGSMASRSPSPSRLSANTTARMARLGNSASQKLSRMFSKPSRIMPPPVAVGRETPRAMEASEAWTRIAVASHSEPITM